MTLIDEVQGKFLHFRFTIMPGSLEEHHGQVKFSWYFGPSDNPQTIDNIQNVLNFQINKNSANKLKRRCINYDKHNNQIILNIRFKVKPGKKEDFRKQLFSLADIMSNETNFVNAIIHDDMDQSEDIVIYEIWKGTQESWLQE